MDAKQGLKVALYLRVSTDGQTVANQGNELREVASAKGWQIVEVFSDKGISGTKGRDGRPGLDKALRQAVQGRYDTLMAWSVDRLGRSLQDLLNTLTEVQGAGCNLYLHRQALDTRTPSGKAMFSMLGVFAEFEREIMKERIHAGLKRARAAGKTLGRPKVSAVVEAKVRALRRLGKGMNAIAKTVGCGTGTVQRVLAQHVREV